MQEFFTQATVAVEVLGFGYIASSFAVYAHHRLHKTPRWQPQRPVVSEPRVMLPTEVSPEPNKRKLSATEELRQQCQEAGIKWRHAHGKNKHLKKAEMIAALAALKYPEPPEPKATQRSTAKTKAKTQKEGPQTPPTRSRRKAA